MRRGLEHALALKNLRASLWEYTDIPVATPVTGKEPEQEQGRERYGSWPGFAWDYVRSTSESSQKYLGSILQQQDILHGQMKIRTSEIWAVTVGITSLDPEAHKIWKNSRELIPSCYTTTYNPSFIHSLHQYLLSHWCNKGQDRVTALKKVSKEGATDKKQALL